MQLDEGRAHRKICFYQQHERKGIRAHKAHQEADHKDEILAKSTKLMKTSVKHTTS